MNGLFRGSPQGSSQRVHWLGKKSANKKSDSSAANRGFEAKLWPTADKLRNNMDAAEYKHIVRVLVEMLAPYDGRDFDPCCGSAGMFALQVGVHEVAPPGENSFRLLFRGIRHSLSHRKISVNSIQ